MKRKTIELFKLKRINHPVFGKTYEYYFHSRNWVKDEFALQYALMGIEKWAKDMQELLKKDKL